MSKINSIISFLLFIFLLGQNTFADCGGRYETIIYNNVDLSDSIQYGQNDQSNGVSLDLHFDIYTGTGDTATDRPVVIMAHGGSFTSGNKTNGEVVEFCEDLAKRGYVAVSMQYRLETNPLAILSEESMVKAVMRAVQDGKALVRFLRANAIDGSNTYGIDHDQIYVGGVSAGGVLGLHLAYMDDSTLLSSNWQTWATSIGGLEGSSGTPGYSSEVSGVVNISGALGDSLYLQPKHTIVPFISFHSEGDGTVIYDYGYPLGVPSLPSLHGSYNLKIRADNLGVHNPFFSYTGAAHPPFLIGGNFDPTILAGHKTEIAAFLYSTLTCNPNNIFGGGTGVATASIGELSVYPNPANGMVKVELPNASIGSHELEVFNSTGQKVIELQGLENSEVSFSTEALSSGIYIIRLENSADPSAVLRTSLIVE